MIYIDRNQTAVSLFINFSDQIALKSGLPMGTIQPFSEGVDNNLYTYNPLNDPNDPLPTVRD